MSENFEKNIRHWKVPAQLSKEEAWERLNSRIGHKKPTKVIHLFTQRHVWVSMAASVALLVGMFFFINNDTTFTITADHGHKEKVNLPDGSLAILNSGSSLQYDKGKFNKSRALVLDGEAFFQVQKGSAFSVVTEKGKVTVLGTSFNVCDREGMYRVSCETGKVKVEHGSSTQFLTRGLKTESEHNVLIEPDACDAEAINDWFEKDLYHFENIALKEVFLELERQFNVKLIAEELPTGQVDADVSLTNIETALDIVCTSFGLEYKKIKTGQFMITKK